MRLNRSAPRARTGIVSNPKRTKSVDQKGGMGKKKGKENEGVDSNSTNWNPDFETRRELKLDDWNKPYVESSNFVRYDDESLIQAFMIDRNEPEACQPQADKVDGFCGKNGIDDCPEDHLVIILDDRSCEPGNERSRGNIGIFTPLTALEELHKPASRPE